MNVYPTQISSMSDAELAEATSKKPKRILVIHEQVLADLSPYTPESATRLMKRWDENRIRRANLEYYRACRSEIRKRADDKKKQAKAAASAGLEGR